jgi:hypothetical protein
MQFFMFEVIDSGNSESEENNQNNTTLRNEINVINGALLTENIFDFLASDFIEI